jgi:Domain of unknown function (DUF4136)
MIREFLLVFLLMTSITDLSVAGEIKTDFDPAASFSNYRTYSLISGTDIAVAGQLKDPDLASSVEDLLRAQLTGKGLEEEEVGGTPDLMVRYWAASQQKQKVTDLDNWGGYDPFWAGGWWAPMWDDVVVTNYQKGTLLVDLIDSKTRKLVWRAYLVGALSEDTEKALEEADKSLGKAFQNYPPKKM